MLLRVSAICFGQLQGAISLIDVYRLYGKLSKMFGKIYIYIYMCVCVCVCVCVCKYSDNCHSNFRFSPCIIIVNHFYYPTNALNYTKLRG